MSRAHLRDALSALRGTATVWLVCKPESVGFGGKRLISDASAILRSTVIFFLLLFYQVT